jgi:HAE1 family hydrophobic/amphiphilic exporter-1
VSLARFGVTRPVPVNILMLVLLIAGVACAVTMTREFFPETTPESASITLPYPGATPEEVEEGLAKKVEDAVADLDEVEMITTTLSEGGGGIIVEFRDGIDSVSKATDEIEREVDSLTDLPDEAERIVVTELEPTLPTIMINVFGDVDEDIIKATLEDIRNDLISLPGMGQVERSGVRDYEVRIDVNADALLEHAVSLPFVADRIRSWMNDMPGGTVRSNVGNINVRTMGVAERAEAIRNIIVRADEGGQMLRVSDIATVSETFVDDQVRTRFRTAEGQGPSGGLTVFRVGDQDAVSIAQLVRSYVQGRRNAGGERDEENDYEPDWRDRMYTLVNWFMALDPSADESRMLKSPRRKAYELGRNSPAPLPAGCHIELSSDLARFIEGRLDLLMRNARMGAILVFATLLLFLNWRAALWVGVGLATALGGTLMMMSITGITLNLLTMFGLIVVIGLLVDDAIVVAENIMARHNRGEPALAAAVGGTNQVFWPVVATVLTSIVAFMPLTFIKGTFGDLLGALPWVVCCALFMSLVESILILPSHMGHSLARYDLRHAGKKLGWIDRFEAWRDRMILDKLVPAFGKLLEFSLRFRYVSLTIALMTLTCTMEIVAGGHLPFVFMATSDAETLVAELRMPIGTPIDATSSYLQRIEDASVAQPEVISTSLIAGARFTMNGPAGVSGSGFGAHLGQVFIELKPVEDRQAEGMRHSDEVKDAIRDAIGTLDGIDSLAFDAIHGGPGGASITVQISGTEESEVAIAVEEIKHTLGTVEGLFEIADDDESGQRELQITLTPAGAALGLDVADSRPTGAWRAVRDRRPRVLLQAGGHRRARAPGRAVEAEPQHDREPVDHHARGRARAVARGRHAGGRIELLDDLVASIGSGRSPSPRTPCRAGRAPRTSSRASSRISGRSSSDTPASSSSWRDGSGSSGRPSSPFPSDSAPPAS